jgi:hypothetical protein
MNVAELIDLLRTFPPDAPVGVMSVAPSGLIVDVETGPVRTIEATVADDGTIDTVWITGVGSCDVAPPALITWPCPCGELITLDQYAYWPDDHDEHLHQRQP